MCKKDWIEYSIKCDFGCSQESIMVLSTTEDKVGCCTKSLGIAGINQGSGARYKGSSSFGIDITTFQDLNLYPQYAKRKKRDLDKIFGAQVLSLD